MLQVKNGERESDTTRQWGSAVTVLICGPVGMNGETRKRDEKVKEAVRGGEKEGQIDRGQDNRSALRERAPESRTTASVPGREAEEDERTVQRKENHKTQDN